ncbi:ABC transporter substrate-binding protein [Paracidovorax cattleyae]|uniref:ABC-type amino acid transport substrate-binding protein n=1 Tax=Paracidovorax cattleyae TaxID=80868 RepID=A0A1H0QZC5_9BURK|nr:ABC transporter substrate-binding protein [Paracidovorax cattleyae]AVS74835.1 amino acid ABC transporter substrate-binding protein [Paracidovorax cattleyae]SDP22098.1 ABC-type amino acid transport substrate-binding protein [Paracidovorax cattleyae]
MRHPLQGLAPGLHGSAAALALAWALAATPLAVGAGPVAERVKARGTLHVCIWPSYRGVTYRDPRTHALSGIDIELSGHFARELGVRLQYVDSSMDAIVADLMDERCDVAMFALGMMLPRLQQLQFSQPYLQSGVFAITTRRSSVIRQWSDLDRPGVAVAVQSGAAIQLQAERHFRHARIVPVRPPDSRERELLSGRVDAFMTTGVYAQQLAQKADWVQLIAPPEPFLGIPAAYAVRPGDEAWLATVEGFVARIKRDGRLREATRRHGLDAMALH